VLCVVALVRARSVEWEEIDVVVGGRKGFSGLGRERAREPLQEGNGPSHSNRIPERHIENPDTEQ